MAGGEVDMVGAVDVSGGVVGSPLGRVRRITSITS